MEEKAEAVHQVHDPHETSLPYMVRAEYESLKVYFHGLFDEVVDSGDNSVTSF